MSEAISDTGPILHLWEIGRTDALRSFTGILIPPMVVVELSRYGVRLPEMSAGSTVTVVSVDEAARRDLLAAQGATEIHPADAEVAVLAQRLRYGTPVLTDDMALRKRLEVEGAVVVGSLGVLVRAYRAKLLSRIEVGAAVDALLSESTLRLGSAFRTYVRSLMTELP